MRSRQRDIFTTIRTEGAILPADLLQRIAAGAKGVEGLDPSSYHLAPGEKLSEAINRSWTRLVGVWTAFKPALAKLPEHDFATSLTRERLLLPLFQELGYGRLLAAQSIEIGGKQYPISHMWQHTPIHLVGWRIEIDRRTPGVPGAAKTTPHGLVQELLNRTEGHLWGAVSNGRRLRLLRDNKTLTRQAYVEFDLEAMLEGEIYSDFSLLWLLIHQSRVEGERPEQCWLEKWSRAAQQQGTRVLDQLRVGVEKAISALGSGFLAHAANPELRERLRSGELTTQDYYRQLLRMVYRLLFLFAAEDRDLLFDPKSDPSARERYIAYYSTTRFRNLAERRRGTDHPDLFHAFRLVIQKLGTPKGCADLALPALGSFLFSDEATPDLDSCKIVNRYFLEAVRSLAITADGNARRAVDYKNLGAEELGSVYESLLELHPTVNTDAATFELKSVAGSERKTTGSYYTHDSLVQCLLDSALDPVVDEAARKTKPEEAILNLKVCDPASGSGHFLIAAAHRMAKRLAAVRTGDEEPSPEATRRALRDVIGHCIYGVDINPMAVELCKVSLWMEALEPGRPLNFLDAHIQCGNSLFGATPGLITKGIPDEAFTPIEGDDKKYCSHFKKENRREFRQESLFGRDTEAWERLGNLPAAYAELDGIDDGTPEGVKKKELHFSDLVRSLGFLNAQFLYDTWCAAFVWKKSDRAHGGFDYPITNEILQRIERSPHDCPLWMRDEIILLRNQYRFFHWHLAFPEVFANGGFDCVLGNPPWEHTEMKEKEWFAERRPDIANARTGAERKRMIETLKIEDPPLYGKFTDALREHDGVSHFLGNSGGYPLCGRGRINLYAVFAEGMRNLLRNSGRVGCVLPTGIATDDTTKHFFHDMVETRSLVSLFDFENRERSLFPEVYYRTRFCLLTSGSGLRPTTGAAEFVFLAYAVEDLSDPERRFTLSADDIALLNPNTRTCPAFHSNRDAELSKAIYRRMPVLIREARGPITEQNPWRIRMRRILNMGLSEVSALSKTITQLSSRDPESSDLAKTDWDQAGYGPIFEGKMFDAFNHRAAGVVFNPLNVQRGAQASESTWTELDDPCYSPRALYWFPWASLGGVDPSPSSGRWILGFKDISSVTNERSMIAAVLPFVPTNFTIRVVQFVDSVEPYGGALFVGVLNSFPFDYLFRQALSGLHASDYLTHQTPFVPPETLLGECRWVTGACCIRDWLIARILELTYTAWDLEMFAQDCGWSGPPFRWSEERRFLLRCELDAAFLHLYLPADRNSDWRIARKADGCPCDETPEQLEELKRHLPTPRDAVAHIMDTFPIVRRKDEEKHGHYRTKDTIIQMYDEMAEAMRTGKPYQTHLDPPPGPPTNPDGTFATLPDWPEGAPKPANWPSHLHEPRRRETACQ